MAGWGSPVVLVLPHDGSAIIAPTMQARPKAEYRRDMRDVSLASWPDLAGWGEYIARSERGPLVVCACMCGSPAVKARAGPGRGSRTRHCCAWTQTGKTGDARQRVHPTTHPASVSQGHPGRHPASTRHLRAIRTASVWLLRRFRACGAPPDAGGVYRLQCISEQGRSRERPERSRYGSKSKSAPERRSRGSARRDGPPGEQPGRRHRRRPRQGGRHGRPGCQRPGRPLQCG